MVGDRGEVRRANQHLVVVLEETRPVAGIDLGLGVLRLDDELRLGQGLHNGSRSRHLDDDGIVVLRVGETVFLFWLEDGAPHKSRWIAQ